MNGPKTQRDNHSVHNHIHALAADKPVNVGTQAVIEKDVQSVVVTEAIHAAQHAQFNGRLRVTSFGDRKGRPGRKVEHAEALTEHAERKQIIVEINDTTLS
jgi:hypothetical protein